MQSEMSTSRLEKSRQPIYRGWRTGRLRLFASHGDDGRAHFSHPITLDLLRTKIFSAQRIQVLETTTHHDITSRILLAFWTQYEKRRPQFSPTLLCEFIRLTDLRGMRKERAAAFLDFMTNAYLERWHHLAKGGVAECDGLG